MYFRDSCYGTNACKITLCGSLPSSFHYRMLDPLEEKDKLYFSAQHSHELSCCAWGPFSSLYSQESSCKSKVVFSNVDPFIEVQGERLTMQNNHKQASLNCSIEFLNVGCTIFKGWGFEGCPLCYSAILSAPMVLFRVPPIIAQYQCGIWSQAFCRQCTMTFTNGSSQATKGLVVLIGSSSG